MLRPSRTPCAFVLISLLGFANGQGIGTNKGESGVPIEMKVCSSSGCTAESLKLTMDANWRWLHDASGTNCYNANMWTCTNADSCAETCLLDGVDYEADAGVSATSNGVKLDYVTKNNIGSRLYALDGESYKTFNMLNREISMDFDVSSLPCGLNGAVYFVEMDKTGDIGGVNKAGAKYGTGYCDGQCARDIKFVKGKANNQDWVPNPEDPNQNTGSGSLGACCAEMDLWEANSKSTAFTAHPAAKPGMTVCTGDAECGNQKDDRYTGQTDRDGCDINAYRLGNKNFYGPGSSFAVDTTQPFTVTTQFFTNDDTDAGDLAEVRQFYTQNGKVISMEQPAVAGIKGNSITKEFCADQKSTWGDKDEFGALGGLTVMGEAFKRGMVLVLSLWDDTASFMNWLDSNDSEGRARGSCDPSAGDPSKLRPQHGSASVTYTNIRHGDIGTTVEKYPPRPSPSPGPMPGPTPPPPAPPVPCADTNSNCGAWAASGECQNNPGYMNVNCKKSCGQCPPAPSPSPATVPVIGLV